MDFRRHPRAPATFSVTCNVRGVETQVQALNISRGGLLVTETQVLALGAMVKMRFSLNGGEPIEIKGFVRHSAKEEGCGVEFIEVMPSLQAKLAAYLEKLDGFSRTASSPDPQP